jgi:hypothetical protein
VSAAGADLEPEAQRIVDGALVELRLERGNRVGHAWLAPEGALLRYPLPEGGTRTLPVPPQLLVDALVRLNDVGPRPGPARTQRIFLPADAFDAVLEARDAERSRLEDADQSAALHELVAGLREHWRVAASWEPAEGQLGGRALEVLDTDGGYWLVLRDGPRVELWPVSPTTVFRGLCRLAPLTSELRGESIG